jgi:hypothetical protein
MCPVHRISLHSDSIECNAVSFDCTPRCETDPQVPRAARTPSTVAEPEGSKRDEAQALFIADCAEDRPGENPSWTEWQNDPDAWILSKFVRSVTGNSTRIKQWVVDSWTAGAIIRTLLNHVAPTLVHLCLDHSMLTDEVYVPVALPALVELTCCFRNPWHHGSNRLYPKQPHVQEQLPVLERLHIVLGQGSPGLYWLNMPRDIPSSLSYVRFSNVFFPFHLLASLSCSEANPWANQETLIIAISAQSRPLLMDMDLQSWRELVSSNQSVYKKIQVLEADERYMMAVYTMIGLIRSKDARSVGRKGPL